MDGGINYYLDHTTLHRIENVLSGESRATSDREALDTIHCLECILLAESVSLSHYGSDSVQPKSDELVEALSPITDAKGKPLIRFVPLGEEKEKTTAILAANDLLVQLGDDLFKPTAIPPNVQSFSRGTPQDVRNPNGDFWRRAFESDQSAETIRAEAESSFEKQATTAACIYGFAHHDLIRDKVLHSMKVGGVWPDEYWDELYIRFRAAYNSQLAQEEQAVYAPGIARSTVLQETHSYALEAVRRTLEKLVVQTSKRFRDNWIPNDFADSNIPTPLVALAALPETMKKFDSKRTVARLLELRGDPGMIELRCRIRELDSRQLDASAHQEIEKECYNLQYGISRRLNLAIPDENPLQRLDVSSWMEGLWTLLTNADSVKHYVSAKAMQKSPRVLFLSDLVARAAREPSLTAAARKLSS